MSKPPRFVVYHCRSTMEQKRFHFEHHAKAHAAKLCLNRNHHDDRPGPLYAYATVEDYNHQGGAHGHSGEHDDRPGISRAVEHAALHVAGIRSLLVDVGGGRDE